MLIFGLDTLCCIHNECTKKNPVLKLISYVLHCFLNFLCISLFFDLFIFIVFSMKFVGDIFSIINSIQLNDFHQ